MPLTGSPKAKQMKYRLNIAEADFNTKTRKVVAFLGRSSRVKVTVMFRGREVQHPEIGNRLLDRITEAVIEVGRPEGSPVFKGRDMTLSYKPKNPPNGVDKVLVRR